MKRCKKEGGGKLVDRGKPANGVYVTGDGDADIVPIGEGGEAAEEVVAGPSRS